QALDKALGSTPDLIITDIVIPGMDGIQLCRCLRAEERTRSVPVLALTAHDERRYPDRARLAGADAVLIKPCEGETLVAEARRLLGLVGASSIASYRLTN